EFGINVVGPGTFFTPANEFDEGVGSPIVPVAGAQFVTASSGADYPLEFKGLYFFGVGALITRATHDLAVLTRAVYNFVALDHAVVVEGIVVANGASAILAESATFVRAPIEAYDGSVVFAVFSTFLDSPPPAAILLVNNST